MPSNSPYLRPATDADLVPWFRLARGTGMYQNFDDAEAERFGRYAVIDNPWRQGRPLGIMAELDGQIVGGVLNFHLPVRLGSWRGTGVAPSAICLSEAARGPLGLALINRYIGQPGYDLLFVHHANELGAAVLRRRHALACQGSDAIFRGMVSSAQSAVEALKLRGTLAGVVAELAPRFLLSLLGRRAGFDEMPIMRQAAPDGFVVDIEGRDSEAVENLCRRIRPPDDAAGIDRAREWLTWRYLRHPRAAQFHVVGVRRGDDLAGIACIELRGKDMARLSDFIAVPEAARDLLHFVAAYALRRGHIGIEGRAGTPVFCAVAEGLGFTVSHTGKPQCWLLPADGITPAAVQADYWTAEHWLH